MTDKALLGARDVMEFLGVKEWRAYQIIRQCNEELRQKGKLVVNGKVNRAYLLKKLDVSEV